MRIWSIHPKYLDSKGLVALWRETLLAKHVLEGKTKGYRNHPQLTRFKQLKKPTEAISQYLQAVYLEAKRRGYNFNETKFNPNFKPTTLNVTTGQLNYERTHLLNKLLTRDPQRHSSLINVKKLEPHPLFQITEGDIEDWEII